MAVSLVRRERTFDAAAFRARPQGTRRRRRTGAAAGLTARVASCLRQPPLAQRRRFAHRADAAWPYRYLDHADLHPCGRGAPEKPGPRPASAGGEVALRFAALTSFPSAVKEPFPARDPFCGHFRKAVSPSRRDGRYTIEDACFLDANRNPLRLKPRSSLY